MAIIRFTAQDARRIMLPALPCAAVLTLRYEEAPECLRYFSSAKSAVSVRVVAGTSGYPVVHGTKRIRFQQES
jgi:hypothetical protein